MNFLTLEQQAQLLKNGSAEEKNKDHFPVVRLFTPDAAASWLITRLSPTLPGLAYGLCDLGLGVPEMGSVALEDLATVRGSKGLPVKRDESFLGRFPISIYAAAARFVGRITIEENALREIAQMQQKG